MRGGGEGGRVTVGDVVCGGGGGDIHGFVSPSQEGNRWMQRVVFSFKKPRDGDGFCRFFCVCDAMWDGRKLGGEEGGKEWSGKGERGGEGGGPFVVVRLPPPQPLPDVMFFFCDNDGRGHCWFSRGRGGGGGDASIRGGVGGGGGRRFIRFLRGSVLTTR